MKFWSISPVCLVVASWFSLSVVVVVEATPTPSTTCASSSGTTNPSSNNNNNNNVFGVPKSTKAAVTPSSAASSILHHIRGGELHSPETLDEVNALVLNAAANGQLVVIDFTASWCGPCKMIAPLVSKESTTLYNISNLLHATTKQKVLTLSFLRSLRRKYV
jgi:thiol-disulfide isomerase/thioredoxin